MVSVGSIFRLKAGPKELKAELTPAFIKVIEVFLGKVIEEPLANPKHFSEITWLERGGPLDRFLMNVFDGLKRPSPTVLPLRTGFGFGKTHAEILLLHAMLSASELSEAIREALRSAGWNEELAARTIILPIDFYVKERPATTLRRMIKACADWKTKFWRGDDVAEEIGRHDFNGMEKSSDFAKAIVDVAKNADLSLLAIIDEVGFGVKRRVEDYLQAKEQKKLEGDPLPQITWLSNFLVNLAGECEREGVSLVLVYAFAEQDERVLEYYAKMDEKVMSYWGSMKVDLFERLGRYTGGITTTALGLDPDDMIKIAIFRTLSPIEESVERTAIARALTNLALSYGLVELDERARIERLLTRYYPLSPHMVFSLRKLAQLEDLPGTEFVRSAIYMLALAAERALSNDPYSPTIDIKHLTLEESCFLGSLGDAQSSWFALVSDLAIATKEAEEKLQGSCEHVSKLILSKGSTANTLTLLRIEDKRHAERYGITLKELQLSTLLTTKPDEVDEALGLTKRAIEHLLRTSSSVEERRIEGEVFYFPALAGTVFSRLQGFLIEEKAQAVKDPLDYLRKSRLLSLILSNVRMDKASIFVTDIECVRNPERLAALVKGALADPRPAIAFVSAHDVTLAREIEKRGFVVVASELAARLSEEEYMRTLGRLLHVVVLLPDVSVDRLKSLLEDLTAYEAAGRFSDYLREEENVVEEFVSKASTLDAVKRLKLPPKEVRKLIEGKVKQEIEVARDIADQLRLRSAREAAKKLISLYKVLAYDLKSKSFISLDVMKLAGKAIESIEEIKAPEVCADAIGTFLSSIIDVRFVSDGSKIGGEVENYLRRRIEEGLLDDVKVSDVVESVVQGSFGAIPLNYKVASNAIEGLSGKTLDFLDKTVAIVIDKGYVRFQAAKKVAPIGIPPERIPLMKVIGEAELLDVPSEDILSSRDFIKALSEEGNIDKLIVGLKYEDGTSLGSINVPTSFTEVIGPVTALARVLKARADLRIVLKRQAEEDSIIKLLGPLRKFYGIKRSH